MNLALALSTVAAVVGVLVALLSLRFGSAPGWKQYRALALVAVSAGLYCGLDAFTTAGLSRTTLVTLAQLQNAIAGLHCAAWLAYVQRRLGGPRATWYRIFRYALFALAAAWLVPGLMATGDVASFEVSWLGVRYDIATPTPLGGLTFVAFLGALAVSMVRSLRAKADARRDGPVNSLALAAIIVTAFSDSLVAAGVLHWPLLLSLGFLVAVGALGWALTRDFVTAARELDRLSRELETQVADRTKALFATETALFRAEKMAAVGQLSAGVAHEINNPAGALSANLSYLSEALARGNLPTDARECLEESSVAVERIAKIVTQLLDSGRAAAEPSRETASVSLQAVVQTALAMSKARIGTNVTTSVDVDASLFVRGDASSLGQVLTNVIVNAAQAIPTERAGRVEVRARKGGERIRIDVEDDGTGMSAATERRLFEPFFTTKPQGEGTGLGLAVSLGLVRSMGGLLSVSTGESGTTVSIELDAAVAPTERTSDTRGRRTRLRSVIVVDDDVAVGRAVARSLKPSVDVELATGVVDALEKLLVREFDLILSDLQMPDGGGRRLYEELAARSPNLAGSVVFFSGGSPSVTDAAFIAQRQIPLLSKPLVLDELFAVAERNVVTRS